MRYSLFKFFFIAALVQCISAQPANYKFDQIGLEQGLSQSTVYAIAQDKYGFMWFGTQDGLNRFDGYSFLIFKNNPDDSNSISNNNIKALLFDSRGALWIGTEGEGLDKYVLSENKFYHYRFREGDSTSISDNHIRSLIEDSDGNVWVGTRRSGLNLYIPGKNIFAKFRYNENDSTSLISNNITSLYIDHSNNLWIGTNRGLSKLIKQKGKIYFKRYFENELITSLCSDKEGNMWIGTWGNGLYMFNEKSGQIKKFSVNKSQSNSIPGNYIQDVYEDSKGLLWVSINGSGLNLFNKETETFEKYIDNIVFNIYEDRSGILWTGTFSSGIKYYDRNKNRFTYYFNITKDSNNEEANVITSILEDTDGNLWAGTYGNGLLYLDRDRKKSERFNFNPAKENSISSNVIRSLCETPDGSIWIATNEAGLNRYDKLKQKFTRYKNIPGNPNTISFDRPTELFYDEEDDCIWIGYANGDISKFYYKLNQFIHFPAEVNFPITVICKTSGNKILAGTFNGIIKQYDSKAGKFSDLISLPKGVLYLYPDKNGIWIGTYGGGLCYYSNSRLKYFTDNEGLPDNNVYGILPDKNGNLWLSTNKGLSKFNISTEEFKNYYVEGGPKSNEFNEASYFISKKGELFFGGMNGITAFFPEDITDNKFIPPVYLTSFQVFGKEISSSNTLVHKKEITLSYFQNFFSFEFAALNYTSPEKNKYVYKLEGFDKDWHYVSSSQRFGSYTNLDPGEYTLRIKASNNDGLWNEEGVSATIIITPPFWMTWWFRALLVIILAGIIVSIYYNRMNKLKKLELIRLRIARDLHDEVGSDLGGIALISQRLQKHNSLPEPVAAELNEISRAAYQTSEKLRDIVWFVNPEHDNSEELVLRLKDLAGRILKDINYTFKTGERVNFKNLDLEARRQIYLIFKEVLFNIVQHAEAQEVKINLEQKNKLLRLIIKDNGKGFIQNKDNNGTNNEDILRGMGLKNISRRAELINGEINISSEYGIGTTVILTVRIP